MSSVAGWSESGAHADHPLLPKFYPQARRGCYSIGIRILSGMINLEPRLYGTNTDLDVAAAPLELLPDDAKE